MDANGTVNEALPQDVPGDDQHFTPTDQLLDFHPTCIGYVTHRFPSHCVVNRDVYVPNKLLDHLPAPVRVGRTQLRLAVKSVSQGHFRWRAVSAWPVAEGEERVHGNGNDDEGTTRQRSGSILAVLSEVPETGSSALALEVREAISWVRRQLARVKVEHEEIATMLGADDAARSADTQARVATLLCATHDGLDASLAAYAELASLVSTTAPPSPDHPPSSPTRAPAPSVTPAATDTSAQRVEAALEVAGTRRRSVSERGELRAETDLSTVAQRLRTLMRESPVSLGQLPGLYSARYHVALDPLALGFARLGQLLKSLGLNAEGPVSTWPTDAGQLAVAMDAVLHINGPLPASTLVERLHEQGHTPGSPTMLLDHAGHWGFPVNGDIIAGRLAPEPYVHFQLPYPDQREFVEPSAFPSDAWNGLRPRAASAPHVFPSPWDDTWSPQSPHQTQGWELSSPNNSVSPPRHWDDSPSIGSASPPPGKRGQGKCTKLFVGGINPITTERTLSRYFVRFGRLVDCFIAKTPGAGPNFAPRSRGFGFVTFAHSSSADMVLRSGPHVLDDRALDVKTAVPKEMMQTGGTPPQGRMPGSPFRHGFASGEADFHDYGSQ